MGNAARARLRLVTPDRIDGGDKLREMASLVRDEASWQSILASAQDDETRAELERAVGPLLAFRQVRCHTPDCESGLDPIWSPVLIVRFRADSDPIWAPIDLRFCPECKNAMTVKDVLSESIWAQVCQQCEDAGENPPTRLLTQLMFDRVM